MQSEETPIHTLRDALPAPRPHRDMAIAQEPMPNFRATPDGPNRMPLSFRTAYGLKGRPRPIALLVEDCQEEYRPYAGVILPNLIRLVSAFRGLRDSGEAACIAWSS